MDDKKVKYHWLFKQKTKQSLSTFYDALVAQVETYIKGDEKRQLGEFNNEMLHNMNQGVLAMGEYFNIMFALPRLSKEEFQQFEKEYYELLKKYKLDKEVIK